MDDFTGADLSSAMSGGSDPGVSPDSSVQQPTSDPIAQPGAATTQPAVETPTPSTPQGPIPFDEHKRIIENARIKGAAEYKARYGWAEQVSQQDLQQALDIARRAQTDPVAYVQDLIAELQSHPTHGQALRSLAAKALASGRGAQAMPEPDVDVVDGNGNVLGKTYSAEAQAKRDEWLFSQWMAKVDEKYAPVVQTHKTLEAQRQADHDRAEGEKFAAKFMGELKDYPHFQTNLKEIGMDVFQQVQQLTNPVTGEADPRTNDPAWLEAATLRAYHRVVTTRQDALSRQAAVQDLTTKATVSGVTPGRPPVGAPKSSPTGEFTADDLKAEFARRRMG